MFIFINMFGMSDFLESKLIEVVCKNFDLCLVGIIEMLDLCCLIYK